MKWTLLCLIFTSITASGGSLEECKGLMDTASRSFKTWYAAVSRCANNHTPGLAGRIEQSLRQNVDQCIKNCSGVGDPTADQCAQACGELIVTLNQAKGHYPARCTN